MRENEKNVGEAKKDEFGVQDSSGERDGDGGADSGEKNTQRQ